MRRSRHGARVAVPALGICAYLLFRVPDTVMARYRALIGSLVQIADADGTTTLEWEPTVHVRFRTGMHLENPLLLLPPEIRASIVTVVPLHTLSGESLARLGSERSKLWFKITFQAGVNMRDAIEQLEQLDVIDVVEPVPQPAPPPPGGVSDHIRGTHASTRTAPRRAVGRRRCSRRHVRPFHRNRT